MSCDIMEVANAHVSGGGEALAAAVRRLAGCLDTRPEALPCDDKRPAGEIFDVICISFASHCNPHIRTLQGTRKLRVKTLRFHYDTFVSIFCRILGAGQC